MLRWCYVLLYQLIVLMSSTVFPLPSRGLNMFFLLLGILCYSRHTSNNQYWHVLTVYWNVNIQFLRFSLKHVSYSQKWCLTDIATSPVVFSLLKQSHEAVWQTIGPSLEVRESLASPQHKTYFPEEFVRHQPWKVVKVACIYLFNFRMHVFDTTDSFGYVRIAAISI